MEAGKTSVVKKKKSDYGVFSSTSGDSGKRGGQTTAQVYGRG